MNRYRVEAVGTTDGEVCWSCALHDVNVSNAIAQGREQYALTSGVDAAKLVDFIAWHQEIIQFGPVARRSSIPLITDR